MKQIIKFIKFFILNSIVIFNAHAALLEKKIVLITPSYNNKDWYLRNLDAARTQNYTNWRMIYIDDCSTDGTAELVEQYIAQHNLQDRITLIRNKGNLGSMTNRYNAIHSCDDTDIMVVYDGDDWLPHDNVLAYINKIYADPDIWLTYGQFKEYLSNRIGFCRQMPQNVIENNSFRSFPDIPSHMRTYYAKLFKSIKKEDLMYEDKFVPMAEDIAAGFPMIEMARHHFKFIPEVLYVYNDANSINDYKKSKTLQRTMDLIIRAKKPYDALETLFSTDELKILFPQNSSDSTKSY